MLKRFQPVYLRTFVVAALFSLIACAHGQVDQTLDEKVQKENVPTDAVALSTAAEKAIRTAPNLTTDERSKLLDLHSRTHEEMTKLREESYKLRNLLLTDVTATDFNQDEVTAIKKRLEKVSEKRLALIFNAVDEAGTILGHKDNSGVLRAFDEFQDIVR